MRDRTIRAVTAGVLLLLVAAGTAGARTSTSTTVAVHKTSLGTVLATAKGHTLYLFAKDKAGKSACSGTCATYWPPLLVKGKPVAGAGVKAALLGTIKRSDGRRQVTYAGHPLYTFVQDTHAGMVAGEGSTAFGAKWEAVSATGHAVLKAPGPATTAPESTTSTSTNPYGPGGY